MEKELLHLAGQAIDLAKKAGANDVVAQVQDHTRATFVYRDGKIEEVKQSTSRGLGLQVYVEGRYSSHQTSDLRPDRLQSFVADAVALTRHLSVDVHRVIPDPALYQNRPDVNLQLDDPAVRDLPREVCLDWLGAMDAAAHNHAQVISATGRVSYGWHASARASSNGFSGAHTGTSVGCGVGITLDDGANGRPEAGRYVNRGHLSDMPEPEGVAKEGLQRALARLGSRKEASVRTMMVVHPEAGGRLMGAVLQALYAQSVQQNRSFLSDKRDIQIASAALTMVDNPLLVRGQASRHYDGEGISARLMPVIEQGVLRNFYVDTYYGRKLGWAPTTGSPSNLVFAPGEKTCAEWIAEVPDGFFVTSWLGGNSDATTGDFSLGFRGHHLVNGQIGAPVSEMNVTGNVLDVLKGLVAVGSDPNEDSGMRTPTLIFEGVEFSGK